MDAGYTDKLSMDRSLYLSDHVLNPVGNTASICQGDTVDVGYTDLMSKYRSLYLGDQALYFM